MRDPGHPHWDPWNQDRRVTDEERLYWADMTPGADDRPSSRRVAACRFCLLEDNALLVDPDCPLHGAGSVEASRRDVEVKG